MNAKEAATTLRTLRDSREQTYPSDPDRERLSEDERDAIDVALAELEMLNDCLIVMEASDDHRERMLARQMRLAMEET